MARPTGRILFGTFAESLSKSSIRAKRRTFEPDRVTRTAERSYPRVYYPRAFSLVQLPSQGGPHIAIVSIQSPDFISQVALLDRKGRVVREYWHSGHFQAITVEDLDNDGTPELLLPGVSNGYSAATLVILDPRNLAGASREPVARLQIQDMPAPVERARLIFSRSYASRCIEQYNSASRAAVIGTHVSVSISELAGLPYTMGHILQFHKNMKLDSVEMGDSTATSYKMLFSAGLIPRIPTRQEDLDELRKIKVVTPWR